MADTYYYTVVFRHKDDNDLNHAWLTISVCLPECGGIVSEILDFVKLHKARAVFICNTPAQVLAAIGMVRLDLPDHVQDPQLSSMV